MSNKVESILFKKVELWFVLLLVVVILVLAVFFASAVRHQATGGRRLGAVGPVVDAVAGFPTLVGAVFRGEGGKNDLLAPEQRFAAERGLKVFADNADRDDYGYVLVNRYDGDSGRSVSELWDLRSSELVHAWTFDAVDELWQGLELETVHGTMSVDHASLRFRNAHGLLTPAGDVYCHAFNSPLLKADPFSDLTIFQQDAIYHHSIERDHEGNFWVPCRIEPKSVNLGGIKFLDDGVAKISPDGSLLFRKSVAQILKQNNFGYLVDGKGQANEDPIHLNDIEPCLSAGILWERGDLFLSLRHQSAVLLYRPRSNKVIWLQQGPWIHQHDVDVLDSRRISIFNNNAPTTGVSDWSVDGVNTLSVYDFSTEKVTTPWQDGFLKLDIRTQTEGLAEVVGEELFVEESNYGRLVQFDAEGSLRWQYINRANDNKLYILNWSRLVSRSLGDAVRTAVRKRGLDEHH